MLKLKSQFLLPILCLVSCVTFSATPARANCPGFGRPPEQVNIEVQKRANQLKDNTNEFFGQKVIDVVSDRRITLTPAFDRFTGSDKRQILRTLQLDGSTVEVYAADGRLVSAQYDGCTRTFLLTERDRFSWYLTRPPIQAPLNLLQEALRNAGNPSWRKVQQSINAADERRARLQFWQTVGYAKDKQGWWIAWVPEEGYFEITVGNGDHATGLKPFLEKASRQYRYVVLTKDGTKLDDTRYSRGNPWNWILTKTSAPQGWQVKPCSGEAPFLCVSKNAQTIGTIEIQRWDFDKMPILQKQFTELGLTPGLITFDNADDKAKVLTALKAEIANSYKVITDDRRQTYGKTYQVQSRPPETAQIGKLPGFNYGFKGIKAGKVEEKYVSYMAFDGFKYLYIIVTSFDPLASTSTFKDLASLEQFEPHL